MVKILSNLDSFLIEMYTSLILFRSRCTDPQLFSGQDHWSQLFTSRGIFLTPPKTHLSWRNRRLNDFFVLRHRRNFLFEEKNEWAKKRRGKSSWYKSLSRGFSRWNRRLLFFSFYELWRDKCMSKTGDAFHMIYCVV